MNKYNVSKEFTTETIATGNMKLAKKNMSIWYRKFVESSPNTKKRAVYSKQLKFYKEDKVGRREREVSKVTYNIKNKKCEAKNQLSKFKA